MSIVNVKDATIVVEDISGIKITANGENTHIHVHLRHSSALTLNYLGESMAQTAKDDFATISSAMNLANSAGSEDGSMF